MHKKTIIDYPNLLDQWHPYKNGILDPKDITHGSHKKVWWKCSVSDDHEWECTIKDRTIKNSKCPCCSGSKIVESNCLKTTHPKLSSEWHLTKNITLTTKDVIAGSHKKIWWKCPVAGDHEWQASIASRALSDKGCPCCRGLRVVGSNCLSSTHPFLIKEWSYKNETNIETIVAGSHKKVWWKCNKNHHWKTSTNSRTNGGHGCPFCSNRKVNMSNCLHSTHTELCGSWDDKKNTITPYEIVAGSSKYVWWLCPRGHSWKSKIYSRALNERGCPTCNESKGEKKIANYLDKNNFTYEREYRISECKNKRTLPFDFVLFLENEMILIEYQGEQHYQTIRKNTKVDLKLIQKRDEIKRKYCKKNNITLLEIPYWNFKKIEKILNKAFQIV